MPESNNKGLKIIIGVLSIFVIILLISLVVIVLGGYKMQKNSSPLNSVQSDTSLVNKIEMSTTNKNFLQEKLNFFTENNKDNSFVAIRNEGNYFVGMTDEQLRAMDEIKLLVAEGENEGKTVNCVYDSNSSNSKQFQNYLPVLYREKVEQVAKGDTTITVLRVCVISNKSPHFSTGGDFSFNSLSEENSLAVVSVSKNNSYTLTVLPLNLSEKENKVYSLDFKNSSDHQIVFSDKTTIYFVSKDYDTTGCDIVDCDEEMAKKANAVKDFNKPVIIYSLDRTTGKMMSSRI